MQQTEPLRLGFALFQGKKIAFFAGAMPVPPLSVLLVALLFVNVQFLPRPELPRVVRGRRNGTFWRFRIGLGWRFLVALLRDVLLQLLLQPHLQVLLEDVLQSPELPADQDVVALLRVNAAGPPQQLFPLSPHYALRPLVQLVLGQRHR